MRESALRSKLVMLVEHSLTLWGYVVGWEGLVGWLGLGGASEVGVESEELVVPWRGEVDAGPAKQLGRESASGCIDLYGWLAVCKKATSGLAALAR